MQPCPGNEPTLRAARHATGALLLAAAIAVWSALAWLRPVQLSTREMHPGGPAFMAGSRRPHRGWELFPNTDPDHRTYLTFFRLRVEWAWWIALLLSAAALAHWARLMIRTRPDLSRRWWPTGRTQVLLAMSLVCVALEIWGYSQRATVFVDELRDRDWLVLWTTVFRVLAALAAITVVRVATDAAAPRDHSHRLSP